MLRQALSYVVARGGPSLLAFATIPLFTRLLTPAEFGQYALVLSWAGLANALVFQWMRLGVLRFYAEHAEAPGMLLRTALVAFGVLCGVGVVVAVGATLLMPQEVPPALAALTLAMIASLAWFELNQQLLAARLEVSRYGVLAFAKAFLFLGIGWAIVRAGGGGYGLVCALVLSMLVSSFALTTRLWWSLRGNFDFGKLRTLVSYGAPLTLTVGLMVVTGYSDRLLIGQVLGGQAAGIYAAAYDLTDQSIAVLMGVVNLAVFPMAIRALHEQGVESARRLLREGASVLLLVALPATVGLVLLAPEVSGALLGREFSAGGRAIMPWVAVGSLVAGLRAYHFDLVFQLTQRTRLQVWIALASAVSNVGLNILLLPRFGVIAAAYTTLISYGVSLGMSVVLGWSFWAGEGPFVTRDAIRIVVGCTVMGVALWGLPPMQPGWVALVAKSAVAVVSYGVAVVALDVYGIRMRLIGR